jgi:hypothetical protein
MQELDSDASSLNTAPQQLSTHIKQHSCQQPPHETSPIIHANPQKPPQQYTT